MIDRLEAKGWVVRRAQDGDRRVNRIYLTAEAERVHKRIWRIAEATVDDALAGLSRREAAQLIELLAPRQGEPRRHCSQSAPRAQSARRARRNPRPARTARSPARR